MIKSIGYTAKHSFNSLKPHEFEREDPKENEVAIDILFCSICHSRHSSSEEQLVGCCLSLYARARSGGPRDECWGFSNATQNWGYGRCRLHDR